VHKQLGARCFSLGVGGVGRARGQQIVAAKIQKEGGESSVIDWRGSQQIKLRQPHEAAGCCRRGATGEGGVAESRYKDAASLAVAAASLSRRPAADAFSAFPLPSPGGFFFFGLESSSPPLTKRLFSVSSSSRAAAVASRVRGAYAVLR